MGYREAEVALSETQNALTHCEEYMSALSLTFFERVQKHTSSYDIALDTTKK